MSQIRGDKQIQAGTIDKGRLQEDFLKGESWNPNEGSATPGTITGIPDPVQPLDVVNKQFLEEKVSEATAAGGVIGPAEDGSYSDGLFVDFTNSTPTGTAIDRFNEVLKALAPSAAPALSSYALTAGSSGKLGFGAASPVSGYTNVPGLDINGTYTVSGNRKGIYAPAGKTGALADNVAPNYVNNRPYPNGAFGDGDAGQLHLEVNGSVVHSVNLASFSSGASVNAQGSGFNLSAATPVQFADGTPFANFKYRTGTYTIAVANQRNGYNTARIRHEISAGVFRDTATFDWVNDDNSGVSISYTGEVLDALAMTGSKKISGVEYHTGGSAQYDLSIVNGYKNSYRTGTPIDLQGTNCTGTDQAVPNATANGDNIVLSNLAIAIATGSRLLNGGINVRTSYQRVIGSAVLSAGQAITGLLLDATAASSTNVLENFDDEAYRMHAGVSLADTNYGSGGAGASAYDWDGSLSLIGADANHNTGLLVAGGRLSYPKVTTHVGTVANGNFGAVANGPAGNPDYSGATGLRTFIRYFYDAGARSNFRLNVQGTGITFVPLSTGPSGNNLTLEVMAPDTTKNASNVNEWKDAALAFSGVDSDKGCYASTFGNSIPTNWGLTLGSKNTSTSGRVIAVRITAAADWTGSIDSIGITWL